MGKDNFYSSIVYTSMGGPLVCTFEIAPAGEPEEREKRTKRHAGARFF